MVSPLDVDGVTIEGLRLRATCRRSLPDEQLTIQMEYRTPRGEGGAFARLEWKPLRPHNNKTFGPFEWRNRDIIGSHHHSFCLNWQWCASFVRRGNLPVALPLAVDPTSYSDFLAIVEAEFRIAGAGALPVPAWEAQLL